jgi:hypothetical protein
LFQASELICGRGLLVQVGNPGGTLILFLLLASKDRYLGNIIILGDLIALVLQQINDFLGQWPLSRLSIQKVYDDLRSLAHKAVEAKHNAKITNKHP